MSYLLTHLDSAAYGAEDDTKTVYNDLVKPIVLSAATGQHGTVFVYGQTGSGKTYTMQGGDLDPFIGSRPKGIIQMAAADIFDRIESSGTRDWTIKASFFEVYNEEVRDLLVPDDNDSLSSICSHSCLPVLAVREDSSGNVRVKAHEEPVTSIQDVSRVLHKGNAHRACGATLKNSRSSRSHAIFRLSIESRPKHTTDDGSNMVRSSVLNLVDLAGSENGITNAGVRRREGGKINQSLLALTRVIQSLGLPDKKRPKYIGYRDSKLTRILKPSLQGDACMAILCCASQTKADLEETRSTLKFAASAKLIKINPTVNEVSDSAVSKLKEELTGLKQALASLQDRYRQREQEMRQERERRQQSPPFERLPPNVTPTDPYMLSAPLASGYFATAASDVSMDASLGPRSKDSDDGPPPPVREVAVVLDGSIPSNPLPDSEERARFLQDKLNASYDVVAGLVRDLQQARGVVQEVHTQNLTLQKRMRALEDELEGPKTAEDIQLDSWMYGVGVFLYAFELNQFLLAALLFMWLSQNFVSDDVKAMNEQKKTEEVPAKLTNV